MPSAEGYPTTPMIVCNTDDYAAVKTFIARPWSTAIDLLEIR